MLVAQSGNAVPDWVLCGCQSWMVKIDSPRTFSAGYNTSSGQCKMARHTPLSCQRLGMLHKLPLLPNQATSMATLNGCVVLQAMAAHAIVLSPYLDADSCGLTLAYHKPIVPDQPALLVLEVANPCVLALFR